MKHLILVVCATLAAVVAGAVDWNRPELASSELNAIKVAAPKAVLVGLPPRVKDVPLLDLKLNAAAHVGRTVATEAVLENTCPTYFNPCFVLRSGSGSRSQVTIKVDAWLPLNVAPAGPSRPVVMSDLLGKKLRVVGMLVSEGSTNSIPPRHIYRFKVFGHEVVGK